MSHVKYIPHHESVKMYERHCLKTCTRKRYRCCTERAHRQHRSINCHSRRGTELLFFPVSPTLDMVWSSELFAKRMGAEGCCCFALPYLLVSLRIFSCLLTFQDSILLNDLFTFTIFLFAGITLYILGNNLLSITHHIYFHPACDFNVLKFIHYFKSSIRRTFVPS